AFEREGDVVTLGDAVNLGGGHRLGDVTLRRFVWPGARPAQWRFHPKDALDARAAPQVVHAQIRRDAVEPRPHAGLVAKLRQTRIRPDEDLLGDVVGVFGI